MLQRLRSNEVRDIEDFVDSRIQARETVIREWTREGFAGGDLVAHRLAHEAMIEASREKREYYADLRKKLSGSGILAALGAVAAAALWAFEAWIRGVK